MLDPAVVLRRTSLGVDDGMAPVRHGLENAEHRRVGNAAFAKILKTPDATEERGVRKTTQIPYVFS